jgi:hypothetical protein
MISTDEGIQIDESEEQARNAYCPIRESLELDSNVTFERVRHPEKQDSQMISTDEGIQIDESDEHSRNANSPIRVSREDDSNRTIETDVLPPKQPQLNSSIEAGISTSTPLPKYTTIDLHSKFIRKDPVTLKLKLVAAIATSFN